MLIHDRLSEISLWKEVFCENRKLREKQYEERRRKDYEEKINKLFEMGKQNKAERDKQVIIKLDKLMIAKRLHYKEKSIKKCLKKNEIVNIKSISTWSKRLLINLLILL